MVREHHYYSQHPTNGEGHVYLFLTRQKEEAQSSPEAHEELKE